MEEITLDDILWQLEKHPIDSDYVFGCKEVKIIYDSIIKLKKENKRMTRTNKHWRKMAINNFSEKKQLRNILTELEEWLKEQWYEIEPKGTGIIFNCEYDSEEDYVRGMETKSKLDTLKNTLNKIQELKEKYK